MNLPEKIELIKKFIDIGVIQYGNFTLKSGQKSSVYFDLRKLYSHPKLLKDVISAIHDKVSDCTRIANLVCGIPNAGVPYATAYSLMYGLPMILLRKEKKEHGMGKRLEGDYLDGQSVMIIEDVVTTGGSLLEGCQALKEEGLDVSVVVAIIDRRPEDKLSEGLGGYEFKSLLTIGDILEYQKLPLTMYNRVLTHPTALKLWNIILEKQTNLCVSIDIDDTYSGNIYNMILSIADNICMVKVHPDIFRKIDFMKQLIKLAEEKKFLIMDDRKYADIGSIVSRQFFNNRALYGGIVDTMTVHSIFGQSTLDGLVNGQEKCKCQVGSFLVAQSSAPDNLIDNEYTNNTVSLANSNMNSVAGFISQKKIAGSSFLYLTPGVHFSATGDELGQGYRTVEDAICRDECDVIIVGRGIYKAHDIEEAALNYRQAGWKALVGRYV